MTYNVIDLFSGAGGLSLGFKQTGKVSIVAAAENNPNARKTYKRNFKIERLYPDVRTINYQELLEAVGNIDIVIGGPPCQGFSNANRQHSTLISMNNRLVKEYVRAICNLKPKAFVMENVSMLKSQVHRFLVEEADFNDARIMGLKLSEDMIEILPENMYFDGALGILKNVISTKGLWNEGFFKTINLLYRYRINREKFEVSLSKHEKKLVTQLTGIITLLDATINLDNLQKIDYDMATAIIGYLSNNIPFNDVIEKIERALFIQKALLKIKELSDNNIHVFEYKESSGKLVAVVKSYAVLDYIRAILESEPYNYVLCENTFNAINYGAPQRRERFVIVGLKRNYAANYVAPAPIFSEGNYRTVYDAIADLQEIVPSTDVNSAYIELPPHPNAVGLEKELRGRILYNHIVTATRATAMARFKALKAGENFHNLNSELKSSYSNAARTQNTIYMRLKYNEPSGTVVNVRKSMWIHPELDRAVSIREAARLQTFPDSFVFEGTKDSQYQQVGNAVPPFLARAIAESIISVLEY